MNLIQFPPLSHAAHQDPYDTNVSNKRDSVASDTPDNDTIRNHALKKLRQIESSKRNTNVNRPTPILELEPGQLIDKSNFISHYNLEIVVKDDFPTLRQAVSLKLNYLYNTNVTLKNKTSISVDACLDHYIKKYNYNKGTVINVIKKFEVEKWIFIDSDHHLHESFGKGSKTFDCFNVIAANLDHNDFMALRSSMLAPETSIVIGNKSLTLDNLRNIPFETFSNKIPFTSVFLNDNKNIKNNFFKKNSDIKKVICFDPLKFQIKSIIDSDLPDHAEIVIEKKTLLLSRLRKIPSFSECNFDYSVFDLLQIYENNTSIDNPSINLNTGQLLDSNANGELHLIDCSFSFSMASKQQLENFQNSNLRSTAMIRFTDREIVLGELRKVNLKSNFISFPFHTVKLINGECYSCDKHSENSLRVIQCDEHDLKLFSYMKNISSLKDSIFLQVSPIPIGALGFYLGDLRKERLDHIGSMLKVMRLNDQAIISQNYPMERIKKISVIKCGETSLLQILSLASSTLPNSICLQTSTEDFGNFGLKLGDLRKTGDILNLKNHYTYVRLNTGAILPSDFTNRYPVCNILCDNFHEPQLKSICDSDINDNKVVNINGRVIKIIDLRTLFKMESSPAIFSLMIQKKS